MTDTEKMDLIIAKLSEHETKMDTMTSEASELREKIDSVESETKRIIRIIENELRINIQRIAEGHRDLSNILCDAMRSNGELVMLSVQIKILNSRVDGLESKLEKFA